MSARWKCCQCCESFDKAGHVEHGGWIEKDGHDGPCPDHQEHRSDAQVVQQ